VLALTAVCAGKPAYAEQAPEPEATRFQFRAPQGCSSAEDFSARVKRRSARIKLVADASARRSLVVEIQAAGGALRGTVTVVEADGSTRTRHLKAATCEEAVEALSLIATVTLDPDALLGEPPPELPEQPPPPPPPTKPPVEPKPRQPPPVPPPRSETYRVSFGLAGALLVQVTPEPAFGATASAALELNPGAALAPFFRLSVTHAQRRGLVQPAGDAAFAFTLPTLDVCPVRIGPRAFGVRPGAFGSLGVLKVWGSGTRLHEETHSRTYGAAGALLWAGWRVSEVVEIVADGRAGLPFWRDEFAFDGATFFKTPTPVFSFGVGAAGGFP
jgi:hypothetical protein